MTTLIFRSGLAENLKSFLAIREAMGRHVESDTKILRLLDQFFDRELPPGESISRTIIEKYLLSIAHLSEGTQGNRMTVLRNFCIHMKYFDPETCNVSTKLLAKRRRYLPYIYSSDEIKTILAAARKIGPDKSIRSDVIYTLVGLLVSTGIRIGEAVSLNIEDVGMRNMVLLIRETKFNKTRNVPLSDSVVKKLMRYKKKRKQVGFSATGKDPFFVNINGRRYTTSGVRDVIIKIMRKVGIRKPKTQKGPRIHDFRHTFAVNRLLMWYRNGDHLMAKLPLLSTYMGHSSISSTEVYLHSTTELLNQVSNRFYMNFSIPNQPKEYNDASKN